MWRKLGWTLGLVLALPVVASAADVTVAWDPSVDPVTSYTLYWGTQSGTYPNSLTTGMQTLGTATNLAAGRSYYFAVRATNAAGLQSAPSTELMVVIPSAMPLANSSTAIFGFTSYPMQGGWYTKTTMNSQGGAFTWSQQPWQLYNQTNGETHPAVGDFDGDGTAETVFGMGRGSSCWLFVNDPGNGAQRWLQVPNPSYCASNGETFPAAGDIDGDGRDEIVVGLGSGGGGRVYIFDDAAAGYAMVRQVTVSWPAYNSANGTVHPAVGDLDGDGLDEIVLGLGTRSQGWLEVLNNSTKNYSTLKWTQLSWVGYDAVNGTTWPAVGDVDGDGRGEIVVGLGVGGGGWLEIFEDASLGLVASRWFQIEWGAYNLTTGETHPAVGNLDGDAGDEIVIGLGTFYDGGWFVVHDDLSRSLRRLYWANMGWAGLRAAGGGAFPALSKRPF